MNRYKVWYVSGLTGKSTTRTFNSDSIDSAQAYVENESTMYPNRVYQIWELKRYRDDSGYGALLNT